MSGGITITKTTTGSLYLPDIQVQVSHRVPTFIPEDKVVNSADLHRALNSRAVFQMLSTITPAPSQVQDFTLEDENRILKEALKQATQQTNTLQASVDGLTSQMNTLVGLVSNLTSGVTGQVQAQVSRIAKEPVSEAVGGEVPMFLPDVALPRDQDVQIQIQEVQSDGGQVQDAQKRLRQLRSR